MYWRILFWAAAVILGFLALGFGVWVWSIYYMVRHSPRRALHVCNRHGLILPDHCIRFMGQPYCPFCYAENRARLGKEGVAEAIKTIKAAGPDPTYKGITR